MTPRSLAWATDVAVLVAGGSSATPHAGALVVASPDEPSFWWGNFVLLDAVPADGEGAVEAFGAAFPGAAHVSIGFDDAVARRGDAAWFAAAGYVIDEVTVLTCPTVPPGPDHAGYTWRPLDSASDWDQHAELAMRCRGDATGITESFVDARRRTRRRLVESGRAQWWGAWTAGGHLVGQLGVVDCGGGRSRYQSVETDPEHRRRGIAGHLVRLAAAGAVADLGANELVIVAEASYWAIELYRSLGFVDRERQVQATLPPPL